MLVNRQDYSLSGIPPYTTQLKKKLNKRDHPKHIRYVEAKQGKAFIQNLPYALTGSRVWAAAKLRSIKNEAKKVERYFQRNRKDQRDY